MAIKYRTKNHTKCSIDLHNLCMMPTVRRYRINLLSRTYADSNVLATDSSPEAQRRGKFGPKSMPCVMVGYKDDSEMLWRIWDPELQRVNAQSEVVLDEERNTQMLWHYESNEIDMFQFPEDEEYVKESDTRDEPLRDSQPIQIGSQPTQIDKRSKSHMHKPPDE